MIMRKIIFLLTIFVSFGYSQHSDAETYYFQSEESEVGKIVYSKKRSEAINEPHAYRFSRDVRPEQLKFQRK